MFPSWVQVRRLTFLTAREYGIAIDLGWTDLGDASWWLGGELRNPPVGSKNSILATSMLGLHWRHSFKPSLRLQTRAAWLFLWYQSDKNRSFQTVIKYSSFLDFHAFLDTQEENKIGPLTWHVCLCFVFFCRDVGGFMMFVCRWSVLRLLVVLRGTKHVEVFPPFATPHLGAYAVHDPLRSHHSKVYPVSGSVTKKLVGSWLIHTAR